MALRMTWRLAAVTAALVLVIATSFLAGCAGRYFEVEHENPVARVGFADPTVIRAGVPAGLAPGGQRGRIRRIELTAEATVRADARVADCCRWRRTPGPRRLPVRRLSRQTML